MSNLQNNILDLLNNHYESLSLTEISSILNIPERQTFKALKKLFAKDKIKQNGSYYYV